MGHYFEIQSKAAGIDTHVKSSDGVAAIREALRLLLENTPWPGEGEAVTVRIMGETVSGGGDFAITIAQVKGRLSDWDKERHVDWGAFESDQRKAADQTPHTHP